MLQVGGFTIGYLREVEASLGGGSAAADGGAAEPEAEAPAEAAPDAVQQQPAKTAASHAVATSQKEAAEEVRMTRSFPSPGLCAGCCHCLSFSDHAVTCENPGGRCALCVCHPLDWRE